VYGIVFPSGVGNGPFQNIYQGGLHGSRGKRTCTKLGSLRRDTVPASWNEEEEPNSKTVVLRPLPYVRTPEILISFVVADFMFVHCCGTLVQATLGNRSNHLYRISPIERGVTG
jgi:hypothetical protein